MNRNQKTRPGGLNKNEPTGGLNKHGTLELKSRGAEFALDLPAFDQCSLYRYWTKSCRELLELELKSRGAEFALDLPAFDQCVLQFCAGNPVGNCLN